MIVRNVSPNLVERLQMMNPKTFVDLYDDGLQVEEIENEKKKNTRSVEGQNYQTGGMQQENTSRVTKVRAIQPPIKFSKFNQPLSKVLERLVQKGLLQPITYSRTPKVQEGRITQLGAHNKETLIELWKCMLSNKKGDSQTLTNLCQNS